MARIEDLVVGQQVLYLENSGYGLRHDWPATIVKVTAKRVTISRNQFPMWKPVSVNPANIHIRRQEVSGAL